MKAVGSSFFSVFVCQEIADKERISDLITDGSASEYGILVMKKQPDDLKNQWLFLVPLIGGIGDIQSPNRQYIPLIYSLLGGYMLPTTF